MPQLRQQMLPDLQFPTVSVIAAYPGATPEIVEQQVAIPIEQAVAGVDGVTDGDLDVAQRLGHRLGQLRLRRGHQDRSRPTSSRR